MEDAQFSVLSNEPFDRLRANGLNRRFLKEVLAAIVERNELEVRLGYNANINIYLLQSGIRLHF